MGVPPLGVRAEKGSGPWAKADAGEVSVHRELLSLPSQCPGEPAKGSVSRRGVTVIAALFQSLPLGVLGGGAGGRILGESQRTRCSYPEKGSLGPEVR